jgi:hypothetical protein
VCPESTGPEFRTLGGTSRLKSLCKGVGEVAAESKIVTLNAYELLKNPLIDFL